MLYLYQVGGNILILGGLFMGWSTKSKFLSVMDAYFIEAARIDPAYETKINQYRSYFGDHYFESAAHFQNYDLKVSKRLLLKGLRLCPFHEKLHNMLTEFAVQDLKMISDSDAKGVLQDQEKLVQTWIQTIYEFSQAHFHLTSEQLGLFFFWEGKIKFRSDQKAEALALFRKSAAYLPKDAGLMLKIADLYLCALDYDQGLVYLNNAIRLDIGCAAYWEGLGDLLFQRRKFDEALSAYEQMLRYYPEKNEIQEKRVQCWLQTGNQLHHSKDFSAAQQAYEQGLTICAENSPSLVHLYNNLGSALQNREAFESALCAYNKALEIDPGYAEALHNKSVLLQLTGETKRAVKPKDQY